MGIEYKCICEFGQRHPQCKARVHYDEEGYEAKWKAEMMALPKEELVDVLWEVSKVVVLQALHQAVQADAINSRVTSLN